MQLGYEISPVSIGHAQIYHCSIEACRGFAEPLGDRSSLRYNLQIRLPVNEQRQSLTKHTMIIDKQYALCHCARSFHPRLCVGRLLRYLKTYRHKRRITLEPLDR